MKSDDQTRQLYKTPEELIALLKSRNLHFKDEKKSALILRENSYFSLIPFRDIFLANGIGTFKENVDFLDIYRFYLFDKDLKTHILRELLEIESKIKSAMAEVISNRYGTSEKNYLNPKNFDARSKYVGKTLDKIRSQKKLYGNKNDRMAYYLKKHHGRCPFWVLSHVITIGAIRDFYFILKPNDQDTIASIVLSLKIKHPARRLGAIIAFLADVRNMCAHDEPLIGFVHRRLDIGPFPEHDRLHIRRTAEGNPVSGRKDVLAILISIKYLVDQKNYSKFISLIVSDIAHLSSDLPFIKKQEILEAIGLCDNYQRLVEKF